MVHFCSPMFSHFLALKNNSYVGKRKMTLSQKGSLLTLLPDLDQTDVSRSLSDLFRETCGLTRLIISFIITLFVKTL